MVDNMQNVLHQHDGVNIMVNVGRTTARYKVISLVDNDYVLHVLHDGVNIMVNLGRTTATVTVTQPRSSQSQCQALVRVDPYLGEHN